MRRICHEMVALFGGRMPHVQGIVAGGASEILTVEKLAEYASLAYIRIRTVPVSRRRPQDRGLFEA